MYYTRLSYHKVKSIVKCEQEDKTQKATNLNEEVFLPDGEVFGIDVSRHQGLIDWEKLSKFSFQYRQFDFAYIKATESEDWLDNQFARNWKEAAKYDINRGAYHFFDPEADPQKQMQHFFSVVKLKDGDLPPMLDVEQESKISTSEYRKKVKTCLELMEAHYKMKPFLYVNQDFYDSYFSISDFAVYPLWISRLKKTPPFQKTWVLWQFTHTAIVPGVKELVDVNVFNGSKNDFKILLK